MQKCILEHAKEKEEIIGIYLSNILTTTINSYFSFLCFFASIKGASIYY